MKPTKVFLASDHGGLEQKSALIKHLKQRGIDTTDLGTHTTDSVDYPDYAELMANTLEQNPEAMGILICGTGIGISIKANRYPHVRAALLVNEFMAEMAKKHNNANVIVFGGRVIDTDTAAKLFDTFYDHDFEGGRHQRRVDKLS